MKVLVIAGEASGDLHGARLIHEIKRLGPDIEFSAVGGERIKSEGVNLLFDCRCLAVVGIVEVLAHMNTILRCFRILKGFLKIQKPDLLIIIDYPDFNLRVAKMAKKMGIKVLYYISPQIWAWRRNRIKFISRWVDKMLVIFPFEENFYRNAGIDTEFVGHPLLDSVRPKISQESFKMKYGLRGDERILALMPGSRKGEVFRILPVMLEGAIRIMRDHSGTWRCALILAPTINQGMLENIIKRYKNTLPLTIVNGHTYEALKAAELAFVASGTATLETAIIGTPMVILYKLNWSTYLIAKNLIRIPAISLVNIVAGERIVPELIQADATAQNLADEGGRILLDPDRRRKMIQGMAGVRRSLGELGATTKAANAVMDFLKVRKNNSITS
jgi:lipid-A-disaccharide synthase